MTSRRTVLLAAAGFLVLAATVALGLLVAPRPVRYEVPVVLREGWTMYEDAAALEAAGVVPAADFLAACTDPVLVGSLGVPAGDAEGFLFPDTYRFRVPTPARQVVERLVRNYHARVDRLLEERRGAVVGLGRTLETGGERALIVLASMVEAEAAVDAERPRIAAVMWNRLTGKDPQVSRLQVDPTATYGCLRLPWLESCRGRRGRAPTRAMLDDAANPYNTYRHDGLPPGPIGNPGLASIRAVLDRPVTDDLFYVARGDGTHVFSKTYAEHQQAVRNAR